MKIYIDENYICHAENAEGRVEVEQGFFDGKSTKFIEGYRYIPEGASYTREDGVELRGEMIYPIVDYDLLERLDLLEKISQSVVANSEYIVQMELEKAMEGII